MSAKRCREEGFGRSSDSSQSHSSGPRRAGAGLAGPRHRDIEARDEEPADLRGCWDAALRVELGLGWKPQLGLKSPFPLLFPDALSRTVRGLPDCVYLGARPAHAYDLHLGLSSAQTYEAQQAGLRSFREAVRKQLVAFEPARPAQQPDTLAFDSFFESGNCDAVRRSRTEMGKYEVFLRPDTGTRGHAQWFYFSVAASRPIQATFLVRNMCKRSSVFGKGGRPFFSRDNLHWLPLETPVEYCETVCTADETWLPRNRALNTLRFGFDFAQGDRIYFAYSPPYTLGTLQRFLERAAATQAGEVLMRRETLCLSLAGLAVPLLRCATPKSGTEADERPVVLVLARAHPGESCGSHVMQGFMEALLSEAPAARGLRDCFEFVLVPMLNPDGVVAGNFRTDLVGDDLNRQFLRPSARFHPAVHHLVYLARQLRARRRLAFCLDLHGHSTRPGVFAYGPQLSATDPLASFAKVLPWLLARQTDMFLFDKCTFTVPRHKRRTARAFFLFQQGTLASAEAKLTYTVESSTAVRLERDRLVPFCVPNYQEMGRRILDALFDTVRVGLQYPPFVEYAFDNHPPTLAVHHPLRNVGLDYKTMLLEINQHCQTTVIKPDPEGGSDSESSAEDISKAQKLKLMDSLELLLNKDYSPDGQRSERKPTRKNSKNPAKSQVRIKLLQQTAIKPRPNSKKETKQVAQSKESSYMKLKEKPYLEDVRFSKQASLTKISAHIEPGSYDRYPYGNPKELAALTDNPTKDPVLGKLWKPPSKPKPAGLYNHKYKPQEHAISQKHITPSRWLAEEGGKFKIQTDHPRISNPKKSSGLMSTPLTPHDFLDSAEQTDNTQKKQGQTLAVKQVKINNLILDASDFIPANPTFSAKQRTSKLEPLTQTRFASLSRPALK